MTITLPILIREMTSGFTGALPPAPSKYISTIDTPLSDLNHQESQHERHQLLSCHHYQLFQQRPRRPGP